MNGKRCNRCGMVNTVDAVYCSNCGGYLDSNMNMNNSMNSNMNNSIDIDKQKAKKRAEKMATIALYMFYVAPLFALYLGSATYNSLLALVCKILILGPIVGIIVMIVGRIKYPYNNSLRVVMWAIIVTIMVMLVLMDFFSQLTFGAY